MLYYTVVFSPTICATINLTVNNFNKYDHNKHESFPQCRMNKIDSLYIMMPPFPSSFTCIHSSIFTLIFILPRAQRFMVAFDNIFCS